MVFDKEFSQYKLRIIGLNTAILSNDDNDQGLRWRSNVEEVFRPASQDGEELVIVPSHHPVLETWLCPSDQENALVMFRAIRIYICAAMSMKQRVRPAGLALETLRRLQQERYTERQHHHIQRPTVTTSRASIVMNKANCDSVWHRRWSDQNKEFKSHVDKLPEGHGILPATNRRGDHLEF